MAGKKTYLTKLCHCIKRVRRTIKGVRKGPGSLARRKEAAAIAICVKSVLQTRKRTLRRFRCTGSKPFLQTQSPK